MENIKQMTQNYVLMMMLRWQRSPSIVYWVALPWPAPVSAHWRWPGEREGHCVCFNPWSELNMETMCLFYICFYSDMIFFCLTQKEWAPTWRSSNWSSFLFLQFWAATLDMDLLIFLLCFTIFFRYFSPCFYQTYLILSPCFCRDDGCLLFGVAALLWTGVCSRSPAQYHHRHHHNCYHHHPHQITTWNSSMPVWTTICWSRVESPKSAASLSSLDRAWLLT